MEDVPVLILAAGASRRMRGRDKLLEPLDGVPLLRRQALMALEVSGAVHVALPPAPHPRDAVLADLDVHLIRVPDPSEGMGASLRTSFAAMTAPRTLLLLADLAALRAEDLRAVLAAPRTASEAVIWRGATADGRGGHPMLVDRAVYPDFVVLTGDDGGRSVVKRHGGHLVPLEGDRARLDLDTPEDWASFLARNDG
ncbi:MAG: NTP transferase domain-containing protein [Pseudomonadota bacterium]